MSKFSRVTFHLFVAWDFHTVSADGLSLESEWQVSRTLFSILADLNNDMVWMVPSAPITISITVTFIVHSFFSSLAKSILNLCLFSLSLIFPVTRWNHKFGRFSLLLLLLFFAITRSGLLTRICWSVCISKSQIIFCVWFSWILHLFVWSNFDFLHNSQWFSFPSQSCLFLYSFYANLLHSLIIWWIVSSLSPQNLPLLFYCVLTIFCVGPYGIILCCNYKRFSYSCKVSSLVLMIYLPPLLNTNSLSMPPLGCDALCIVISFLRVPVSIYYYYYSKRKLFFCGLDSFSSSSYHHFLQDSFLWFFRIVSKAPTVISITDTVMFNNLFSSLARC